MIVDVCAAEDLQPGSMIVAQAGAERVVVIRDADGNLQGLLDRCPHQGGPLSRGKLQIGVTGESPGDYRESGETILKCPWHGFEFDVATGCAVFDSRRRVRRFAVREESGRVLIEQ